MLHYAEIKRCFILLKRRFIFFKQRFKNFFSLINPKALYAVVLSCLLVLTGCGKKTVKSDKKIFYYNESAGISTLDPAFAKDQALIWACNQLYNGLVQLDNDMNVLPCIAKSWQISEDKRTYTFTIRDDVYFHDDKCFSEPQKVTAHDFVYSFNRITDEKTASPGIWIFSHIEKTDKYHFIALNDTTLEIKLKEPFAPFLGLLTMPYAFVVSQKAVEYYKESYRTHPVGTGAFRFKYWKEGVKLVLLKNDNYFEKDSLNNPLPYLDAVNVSFITDKQSVFLEFIKGNIDFISGIDPNYKDEVLTKKGTLQPKYKDRINLLRQSYLNTEYLGFFLGGDASDPLNNRLIRQAINYGFDRKKMVKYLRNNIGSAALGGMVPPVLLGSVQSEKGYDYNPEKAKELLTKAGYYKTTPEITLTTTASYSDLCKYIQQQLILLGMKVKLQTAPAAELRQNMAEGKVPFFRGSWIADYPDAENYLSLFYSKNFAPVGPNYTHFSDKTFDLLYEQCLRETDEVKRRELYRRMNDMVIEQAPVVVLYYDEVLRFVQRNITGLEPNAMNLLILKNVDKQQ